MKKPVHASQIKCRSPPFLMLNKPIQKSETEEMPYGRRKKSSKLQKDISSGK